MGWVSCEECTGRHREEGRLPQKSYLRSVEMLVSILINCFLSTLMPSTQFNAIGDQEMMLLQ